MWVADMHNLPSTLEHFHSIKHIKSSGANGLWVVRSFAFCIAEQPAQNTALHVASLNGDVPVVKILLSHKADVDATDSQGRTALGNVLGLQKQYKAGDSNTRRMSKFMDMERYPDVIQLLQKAGARTK
jgi:hypothetical protein